MIKTHFAFETATVPAFLSQVNGPVRGPVQEQTIDLGVILTLGGIGADRIVGGQAGAFSDWPKRSEHMMNQLAATLFGGLAARIALN